MTAVIALGHVVLKVRDLDRAAYFADPDGNVLECYVDGDPAIWREDPATVATIRPLRL